MNLLKSFMNCLEIEDCYIHVENGGDFFLRRECDTLKIFFEWSDGAEDWLNNFRFLAIPRKPYKHMRSVWFCHRGFFKVWKSIKPYICKDILDPDIHKIEIVGYSHGAAIALLCYEYCKYHRPDIEVSGVGFGAPRVFWGYVPKEVKERCKGFIAVRNGVDIVTHLPPALFGYHHISKVMRIGKHGLIKDHFPEHYYLNLTKIFKGADEEWLSMLILRREMEKRKSRRIFK